MRFLVIFFIIEVKLKKRDEKTTNIEKTQLFYDYAESKGNFLGNTNILDCNTIFQKEKFGTEFLLKHPQG